MKRIVGVIGGAIALVCVAWALWWQALASGQEVAIAAWFDARRDQGWQAEHGPVEVAGFPVRLERQIRSIELTDPKTGWSWSLPEVEFAGEATSPTVIQVSLPDRHTLSLPREQVDIGHSRMTADLSLAPDTKLSWRRGAIDGTDLTLEAKSGWTGAAKTLNAEIKERSPASAPPNSYAVRMSSTRVSIPKPLLSQIDPTGLLEPTVDEIRLNGTAALRAPIDRFALEEGKLALNAATVREAVLTWGDLEVKASGQIKTDMRGYATGEIDLKLRKWREMIRIARKSGAVDSRMINTIEQALRFVSTIAGSGEDVDLTIKLNGGKVKIGPIAIGNAPRLAPPA